MFHEHRHAAFLRDRARPQEHGARDAPPADIAAQTRARRLDTRDERSVVGHLGPDPLRDDWDPAEARRRIEATDAGRTVAAVLLDQRVLAGLGNLWANEVCFLRGVSPFSPVGAVDAAALVRVAARGLQASVRVPGMFQTTTGNTRRGARHWVAGIQLVLLLLPALLLENLPYPD